MDDETIASKIQFIVREVLDNDTLLIGNNTEAADVEGWDSLAHINILSQIESEFGIRFSLDELAKFSNVGKIVETVRKRAS